MGAFPFLAAHISFVSPSLFMWLTSAPRSNNSLDISRLATFFEPAAARAVSPTQFLMLGSAP